MSTPMVNSFCGTCRQFHSDEKHDCTRDKEVAALETKLAAARKLADAVEAFSRVCPTGAFIKTGVADAIELGDALDAFRELDGEAGK